MTIRYVVNKNRDIPPRFQGNLMVRNKFHDWEVSLPSLLQFYVRVRGFWQSHPPQLVLWACTRIVILPGFSVYFHIPWFSSSSLCLGNRHVLLQLY